MDDESNSWICAKCGYNLQGLGEDSLCPECGSSERVLDLTNVYRASNIKYACAFTSGACVVFAISLSVSAVGTEPAFYGLSSWWLLLGWLAGSVFYFVGITTLSSAQFGAFATQKLPIRAGYILLLLGIFSGFMLFKASYELPKLFYPSLSAFRLGIYTSPAIAISTGLLPALLGLHFKKINRSGISRKLFAVAGGLLICACLTVGLYVLTWLDWTYGIDLYLSQPNGYAGMITYALKASVLLGACVSMYGLYAGILAYRTVK